MRQAFGRCFLTRRRERYGGRNDCLAYEVELRPWSRARRILTDAGRCLGAYRDGTVWVQQMLVMISTLCYVRSNGRVGMLDRWSVNAQLSI